MAQRIVTVELFGGPMDGEHVNLGWDLFSSGMVRVPIQTYAAAFDPDPEPTSCMAVAEYRQHLVYLTRFDFVRVTQ